MQTATKKINYNKATDLSFLHSGEEYFSVLLKVIRNAEKILYLQAYTLCADNTGLMIMEALGEAARRNVKVYVLLDAYGSKELSNTYIQQMRRAGIHCRRFSPILFLKLRAGRRLHHKITVADGAIALIGGINISDKYRGDKKTLPWLDFAVQVAGPVCIELQKLCERMYYPDRIASDEKRNKRKIPEDAPYLVQVVHSDWFRRKNKINYHFKKAIRHAEKDVIIICSYFLPSFRLMTLLKQASKRDIRIQLYLQGRSDLPIVRNATRFFYRVFFQHNMQIFEFPKRVLHAKLWMADNKVLSLGSYNFNHLSEYTSVETNIEISHAAFCKKVKEDLRMLFEEHAEPVNKDFYLKKLGIWQRFVLWISYTITTLAMKLAFAFTSKSS